MEDKKQYEAFMEELKKLANNFRDVVTELGDILAKILPDVEIPEEEEDTWEMKCPYENGDVYYIITTSGLVNRYYWDNDSFENMDFKQGNIFPTEEAAELESKRRNLLTRFRAFRDECNGDWKADWKNDEDKYYLCFYKNKLDLAPNVSVNYVSEFGYFKNLKDAQRAIELFGDEIKELFVDGE